jgi:dihydrofolate reductase
MFMRSLVYYVAVTLDGFIAAHDGSYDAFLTSGEHADAQFAEFPETVPAHLRESIGVQGAANREFDAVLMGRATYALGEQYGMLSPYPHLHQYLFSRSLTVSPHADVTLVRNGTVEMVRQLKSQPGKSIWLCGGGVLATALFAEIDEVILKVHPSILGDGIPVFSAAVPRSVVEPYHVEDYANGVSVRRHRIKPALSV